MIVQLRKSNENGKATMMLVQREGMIIDEE